MNNLAILIPAYNEEMTIGKVISDVQRETKNIPDTAIYVYDNNSKDNTVDIAKKSGAIVRHEYAQGKGAVIRRMFREIDADVYIMIDADDTYPVDVIEKMYNKVKNKSVDMVVGDRLSSTYFTENKRLFHNFGNTLVRNLINRFFKTNIRDILTGYRAFSYRFVKTFPVLSRGFEIETEMSIHAAEYNMLVENQVVDYRDRPEGSESKLNTLQDGFSVLITLSNLFRTYHPLAFYSVFSAVFLGLSTVLFIFRVFLPYSSTHTVENFPTLIVSTILLVLSFITFFSGAILDSIQSTNRRNFELNLIQVEMKKQKMDKENEAEI
ncbi:glycosyltransferase family 2 protein [Fructobacillus sp. W13]|uniref:Glycosyltransferase family 2 protein n=1 Tax=Fructobacillus apis TaxID=2935017 RepID=A0ABT0ZNW2_9LACO|nr:glycosyltransferase family 2 protein [Fructobacillus apis]MCO0831682.1 glycosyltransferase family 2 protein [Fructobacillus apis]